jgi:hypothetical protein
VASLAPITSAAGRRRERGRRRPYGDAAADHVLDADPFDQKSERHQADDVGPKKAGEQIAHLHRREAVLGDDGLRGDRQRNAVDVIDDHHREDQDCNPGSAIRHLVPRLASFPNLRLSAGPTFFVRRP